MAPACDPAEPAAFDGGAGRVEGFGRADGLEAEGLEVGDVGGEATNVAARGGARVLLYGVVGEEAGRKE